MSLSHYYPNLEIFSFGRWLEFYCHDQIPKADKFSQFLAGMAALVIESARAGLPPAAGIMLWIFVKSLEMEEHHHGELIF